MKKIGLEELLEIQKACVSAQGSPDGVVDWISSIGIEEDAYLQLAKMAGEAAALAAAFAQKMNVDPAQFLSAVFSSGFEFGVRVQQSREVTI